MSGDATPPGQDDLMEIQKAFRIYDKDRNGYVTMQEAHAVLQTVLGLEEPQTRRLIETYDRNGDGRLSYDEFIWFYSKIRQKQGELITIFQKFDRDGSGSISVEEAKAALRQMDFEDEEAEVLVRLHDRNGDGVLQFEEFVQFWKTCGNLQNE